MTVFIIGCEKCHHTTGCVSGKDESQCNNCPFLSLCDMQEEEPDISRTCDICKAREKFFKEVSNGIN